MEVESKKLYLDWGFGSLFSYVTEELHYSEASASRRIAAMRLLRKEKDLGEKLESGVLTLTAAAQVQSTLKQMKSPTPEVRKELIQVVEGKSTREAEQSLLEIAKKLEPGFLPTQKESLRGQTLKMSVSSELEQKLNRLKSLLSHKNPNLSYSELIELLADHALKELDPLKKKASAPAPGFSTNPRYIPAATRRYIYQKGLGRCTYQDPVTKRRCSSRHLIQVDHKTPVFFGGGSTADNLRLLCGPHNRREAEKLGILRAS